MYIPGTTYLHILLHCTLYLIAHLTPYFISLFVSYLILTIFVYIYTLSCFLFHSFLLLLCYFFYFIIMFYFSFLHFPLSGPVPTNISLPIIPCMIVYVTNNKEPWTLNLDMLICCSINIYFYYQCWKQMCFLKMSRKPRYIWFQDCLMNRKIIWKLIFGIFCNIINVFTVTFDHFNASLLNSINILKNNIK